MSKIKIAIAGSSGRMGRILLENVFESWCCTPRWNTAAAN
jgi:dihydrodipicolinate reductase